MPDSYSKIILHTTFSTKYRQPRITPTIEPLVLGTLRHHLNFLGSTVLEMNAAADHVHILHLLPRTLPVAKVIQEAKKWSSVAVHEQYPNHPFAWQLGYATFSVSHDRIETVRGYIRRQKEHHDCDDAGTSFEEEFRTFLTLHDLRINERYLFPKSPEAA